MHAPHTRGKNALTWATLAKEGQQRAKWGYTGLIFCMQEYFHEMKISCLASQALKQKEEVICRTNPANSDLFAGLIRQIVAYLPDKIWQIVAYLPD